MNTFGNNFRITIFGTSHSEELGVVIDGCPAGIEINTDDLMVELERRKPNQIGTTERVENDIPKIIGLFNDKTTGSTITIIFKNSNIKEDYTANEKTSIIRPSHADYTANYKYKGFNDYRGGGEFSGRMTTPIVAAGFIAKQIIPDIKINANIHSIGGIINDCKYNNISNEIIKLVEETKNDNDSLGGIIECKINNIPTGLGNPFFDTIESMLAHIIFAIPGCKGIEFGTGFNIANMLGSNANDCYIDINGKTKTNHSGGINGGLTNGNPISFKVAFRPTPSIKKPQQTFNFSTNKMDVLELKGRFDVCYVLRTPVIIEAVASIVLADFMLSNH